MTQHFKESRIVRFHSEIIHFLFILSLVTFSNLTTRADEIEKRASIQDIFEEFTYTETKEANYPYFSIKTNVIPWIGTIPNLNGEIKVSDLISIDLSLWWCPWKISEKYSLKTFAFLPELRFWLAPDWKGHFFGLHFTAGWYNLRLNQDRYQDYDRPALGAGLTYGYFFEFNENWGMELFLGAGYINLLYDRYYNIPNGALIDKRTTSYWGIDRLGITVSYRFSK